MKKYFITALAFVLLTIIGSWCYATGDDVKISSFGQIEITDYMLIIGAVVFIIGMTLVLLSLFLNASQKKTKLTDDEYTDESDDINIIYDESYNIADNYNIEDAEADDLSYEDALENDNFVTITKDNPVDNADITYSSYDTPEADAAFDYTEDEESAIEETANTPESTEETVPSSSDSEAIRLTISGMNSSDIKMIELIDSIVIGRRSSCDMSISDSTISGEHCKLTYDGTSLFIEDLNSTNGTYLNGEQIEKAEIKSGDIIILGQRQYKVTVS